MLHGLLAGHLPQGNTGRQMSLHAESLEASSRGGLAWTCTCRQDGRHKGTRAELTSCRSAPQAGWQARHLSVDHLDAPQTERWHGVQPGEMLQMSAWPTFFLAFTASSS